jgi:hypothetical protein
MLSRSLLHTALHVIVPAVAARLGWRDRFWKAYAILIGTMIVDLDHLLADPIFDPNRCSLGFHPLHSVAAVGAYALLSVVPERRWVRLVGIGLLIHMGLDGLDCLWMGWER